jgi:hypothetical protein
MTYPQRITVPKLSYSQSQHHRTVVIRQNGCPNCIKFRMTLNRKQNRGLSRQTREMRHAMADDEPLQLEDLFTRLKPNRQRQNYHRSALRKLKKTLRST